MSHNKSQTLPTNIGTGGIFPLPSPGLESFPGPRSFIARTVHRNRGLLCSNGWLANSGQTALHGIKKKGPQPLFDYLNSQGSY
ncbi:MAG: hypothetical protein ACR2QR_04375 [Woeseiaceae bacterium]